MSGPTINRAESSGDIWTPWEFIHAVEAKFGLIGWDLAATLQSSRAHYTGFHITAEQDTFRFSWASLPNPHGDYGRDRPLLWLNPPYADIVPWAEKCVAESAEGAEVLLLVPGSIGAKWYWQAVEPFATVYSVGRIVFDNCFDKEGKRVTTPYPKDLILAHYHPQRMLKPMQRWEWKKEVTNGSQETKRRSANHQPVSQAD